ncbi:MAG: hypothetical protein DMG57_13555 [Acidobacteria bacterium]|nr:MAG: hypothetical protein DMG57_13555 [Acidobacteriota bacterium]
MEFSDALIPNTTQKIFDRFQAAGFLPVVTPGAQCRLAKPDRSTGVMGGKWGWCKSRPNLSSGGRTARRIAIELFDRNLVHFVASDAHDTKHRPPILLDAPAYVSKRWAKSALKVFLSRLRALRSWVSHSILITGSDLRAGENGTAK